jgi:hypothetical protein
MPHVIVWDIETVPDLKGFAAANGHDGKTDDEIRVELGEKFPKHIYHSIICISALIAHKENEHWVVDALGAPHVGNRSERDLIAAFVEKVAELKPSFDLPVVRYVRWSTKCPPLVCWHVPTFTGTPMMRLICVTCCLRLHPELRLVYMNFAGLWDCRENPTPSTERM